MRYCDHASARRSDLESVTRGHEDIVKKSVLDHRDARSVEICSEDSCELLAVTISLPRLPSIWW